MRDKLIKTLTVFTGHILNVLWIAVLMFIGIFAFIAMAILISLVIWGLTYNLAVSALALFGVCVILGTVEEFKALKEIDEDLRLKYCYEDLSSAENRGYMKGCNEAIVEFANFLHKKAKENNGLRLSSDTRSWTQPNIFDYVEEFKNEQICKEED